MLTNRYYYILSSLFAISTNAMAIEGTFSFEKFYRLNTPTGKTDTTEWGGLNLYHEKKDADSKTKLDTDLRLYFNNSNDIQYSLAEAYYQTEGEGRTTYGRQVLDWSRNEKYWQLGKLNGTQGMTLLGTKQEGITGVLYERKLPWNLKIDLFGSFLYIPTLNPALKVEDGVITSNSEWSRTPPKQTIISDRVVDIMYDIKYPNVTDVAFQKSLGGNLTYEWNSGFISWYTIYKPENNLRINADASYNQEIDKVVAEANPVVNHHLMYGGQLLQSFGDVDGIIGFDVSDPNAKLGKDFDVLNTIELEENNKTFESKYFTIKPNYDKEAYFHMSSVLKKDYYLVSLNYVHLMSENQRGSDDFYSDTVKWKRAVGLMVKYDFSDNLKFAVDMKHDLARGDNILRMEGFYGFGKNVSFKIGAELLRAPEETSYWSAYRANDIVYSSMNYHF